jgi:hypothetical protein
MPSASKLHRHRHDHQRERVLRGIEEIEVVPDFPEIAEARARGCAECQRDRLHQRDEEQQQQEDQRGGNEDIRAQGGAAAHPSPKPLPQGGF